MGGEACRSFQSEKMKAGSWRGLLQRRALRFWVSNYMLCDAVTRFRDVADKIGCPVVCTILFDWQLKPTIQNVEDPSCQLRWHDDVGRQLSSFWTLIGTTSSGPSALNNIGIGVFTVCVLKALKPSNQQPDGLNE